MDLNRAALAKTLFDPFAVDWYCSDLCEKSHLLESIGPPAGSFAELIESLGSLRVGESANLSGREIFDLAAAQYQGCQRLSLERHSLVVSIGLYLQQAFSPGEPFLGSREELVELNSRLLSLARKALVEAGRQLPLRLQPARSVSFDRPSLWQEMGRGGSALELLFVHHTLFPQSRLPEESFSLLWDSRGSFRLSVSAQSLSQRQNRSLPRRIKKSCSRRGTKESVHYSHKVVWKRG